MQTTAMGRRQQLRFVRLSEADPTTIQSGESLSLDLNDKGRGFGPSPFVSLQASSRTTWISPT